MYVVSLFYAPHHTLLHSQNVCICVMHLLLGVVPVCIRGTSVHDNAGCIIMGLACICFNMHESCPVILTVKYTSAVESELRYLSLLCIG